LLENLENTKSRYYIPSYSKDPFQASQPYEQGAAFGDHLGDRKLGDLQIFLGYLIFYVSRSFASINSSEKEWGQNGLHLVHHPDYE
jgi:hypothetical protein